MWYCQVVARLATREQLQADIATTCSHLRAREGGDCRAVVALGFCMGGRLAFFCAASRDVAGVIGFYGAPGIAGPYGPGPTQHAHELRAPILGLFGGADEGIPPSEVAAFEQALTAAGVEHEIVTYPSAPHGFFDVHHSEFAHASAHAWQRVLAFLNQRTPTPPTPDPVAHSSTRVGTASRLGLSINNAFGRLWPANCPAGLEGNGSSSICDPDGRPLKGAPNPRTGGVYYGQLTGRQPAQIIPGALDRAAVGIAFLGASPDGSGRAVFSVVVADGSNRAGAHRQGARRDRAGRDRAAARRSRLAPQRPHAAARCRRELHADDHSDVSQPFDDSIKAIGLAVGGPTGNEVFTPSTTRVIRSEALAQPVDLAPVPS